MNRNRPKPPTPKERVLSQLRPQVGEATVTGTAMTIKEVLRKAIE